MKTKLITFILLITITTQFSCEKSEEIALEQSNQEQFNLDYILNNPKLFVSISENNIKRRALLSRNSFDVERLEYLINKSPLTSQEEIELLFIINNLGFESIVEYKDYMINLNTLGVFLVDNTNIENLASDEINSILLEYYETIGMFLPSRSCQSDYNQCEEDVSAALGIDLLNCAVVTAVTGLGAGGVGGLIVGASCTATALYHASQASSACHATYQNCQNQTL